MTKFTKQAFLDFLNTRYSSHNDAAAALGQTYRRHGVTLTGFNDNNGTAQLRFSSNKVCALYGRQILVDNLIRDLNGGYITHNGRFSKAAVLRHLDSVRNLRYYTEDAEYRDIYVDVNRGIADEAGFLISAVTTFGH